MPVAGNHHDVTNIRDRLERLIEQLAEPGISVVMPDRDGLFVNVDAGFDSYKSKDACQQAGIQLNVLVIIVVLSNGGRSIPILMNCSTSSDIK